MPAAELYRRQAALLVKAIPLVAAETCFALKGGTAIISLCGTCPVSRWISI
jgi:hypothetical protein